MWVIYQLVKAGWLDPEGLSGLLWLRKWRWDGWIFKSFSSKDDFEKVKVRLMDPQRVSLVKDEFDWENEMIWSLKIFTYLLRFWLRKGKWDDFILKEVHLLRPATATADILGARSGHLTSHWRVSRRVDITDPCKRRHTIFHMSVKNGPKLPSLFPLFSF